MDTSVSDIVFDKDGVCNYCKAYERDASSLHTGEARDRKLASIIDTIKQSGANKPYDCLLGVSGGVDSTYVCYLSKKYGLRPLAVHLDNGWDSELSVANIEKTLKVLGIELHTHVIDWEEFRDLQLAFLRSSITNLELPTDHAITAQLFKTAAEQRIRYILNGNNTVTEAIQPTNWGEYNKDLRLIKGIQRRFGTRRLKTFPTMGIAGFAYNTFARRIQSISLLDYVDYHKDKAISILEKELGWQYYGGKHYESIFTRFFQGYILPEKYGVDKRLGHNSTLVMSGQITRDEALRRMDEPVYPPDMLKSDMEYVLKKFGLSQDDFYELMALPIKSHRDYPSNMPIFLKYGNLLRRFKRYVQRGK